MVREPLLSQHLKKEQLPSNLAFEGGKVRSVSLELSFTSDLEEKLKILVQF